MNRLTALVALTAALSAAPALAKADNCASVQINLNMATEFSKNAIAYQNEGNDDLAKAEWDNLEHYLDMTDYSDVLDCGRAARLAYWTDSYVLAYHNALQSGASNVVVEGAATCLSGAFEAGYAEKYPAQYAVRKQSLKNLYAKHHMKWKSIESRPPW